MTKKIPSPAPAAPEPEVDTIPTWSGFAVAHGDDLLVDTIMPTERGAKVNYLGVYCQHIVTADTEDYQIDTAFDLWVQRGFDRGVDVYIAPVTIGKTQAELEAEGFSVHGDDSDESEAA